MLVKRTQWAMQEQKPAHVLYWKSLNFKIFHINMRKGLYEFALFIGNHDQNGK